MIRLYGTLWDHENMFHITGGLYEGIVDKFLAKDWGMKINSLLPDVPYKRVHKSGLYCSESYQYLYGDVFC